jgi:chromosome segregation ATPase
VTPPSKLRSEIINLRQQLAEKEAAIPILRQKLSILEIDLEEKAQEAVGTPKAALRSKINHLEKLLRQNVKEQLNMAMEVSCSSEGNYLQELKDDCIQTNNEKCRVEVKLQEKVEQMAELESKFTHTNTTLNRISGERDVLLIRLQETKAALGEITVQRDELREKCRETDGEYEELLVEYREVEVKSKTFQTQAIKLRQENDELALKLKNLGNEVSSMNAVDHSKCQQQAKEMEKAVEQKNRDMMTLKRELSNVRGEFMHLKFRISNEPGIFDASEEHKQKIKEADEKIALQRDEVIICFYLQLIDVPLFLLK